MIAYKDYSTFTVLGVEINLFSETLEIGLNTVAEMGERIHYLGKENPNIAGAILAWQEMNGRDLTDEELRQVLTENHLISGAV